MPTLIETIHDEAPLASFPDSVIAVSKVSAPSEAETTQIINYNAALAVGNYAVCQQILANYPNLLNCQITSTTINTIIDEIKAIELYYNGSISQMISEAAAHAGQINDSSASTITTYSSSKINELISSLSAASAGRLSTPRTIDGVNFDGQANIVHFGLCSSAANTVAKTVSCTGFVLATGARISVMFANDNTANNPTLNVNSTGAKSIYYNGANIPAAYLKSGVVHTFVYDGTRYVISGGFGLDTKADVSIVTNANTVRSATLTSSGWSNSAPYAQTVTVTGITSSDRPMITWGAPSSRTAANYKALKRAFAMIDSAETGTNTITFVCYSNRPTVNIPILIKGV